MVILNIIRVPLEVLYVHVVSTRVAPRRELLVHRWPSALLAGAYCRAWHAGPAGARRAPFRGPSEQCRGWRRSGESRCAVASSCMTDGSSRRRLVFAARPTAAIISSSTNGSTAHASWGPHLRSDVRIDHSHAASCVWLSVIMMLMMWWFVWLRNLDPGASEGGGRREDHTAATNPELSS